MFQYIWGHYFFNILYSNFNSCTGMNCMQSNVFPRWLINWLSILHHHEDFELQFDSYLPLALAKTYQNQNYSKVKWLEKLTFVGIQMMIPYLNFWECFFCFLWAIENWFWRSEIHYFRTHNLFCFEGQPIWPNEQLQNISRCRSAPQWKLRWSFCVFFDWQKAHCGLESFCSIDV